jgi:hypothetical protein
MLLLKIDGQIRKPQQPHKLSPIQFYCTDFALQIFNLLDSNQSLFHRSSFARFYAHRNLRTKRTQ